MSLQAASSGLPPPQAEIFDFLPFNPIVQTWCRRHHKGANQQLVALSNRRSQQPVQRSEGQIPRRAARYLSLNFNG